MIDNLINPKRVVHASDWECKLCSVGILLLLAIEPWHNRMCSVKLGRILFDPSQCYSLDEAVYSVFWR